MDNYGWHDLIDVAGIRGDIIGQTLETAQQAAADAKAYAKNAGTYCQDAELALDGAQRVQSVCEQARDLAVNSEAVARQASQEAMHYSDTAGLDADTAMQAATDAEAAARSANDAANAAMNAANSIDAKIAAKGDKPKTTIVTLLADNWDETDNNQQLAEVSGVLADETLQLIQICPAGESMAAYYGAGIICTGQYDGGVGFTAQTIPSVDLTVYVVVTEVQTA